MRFVVCGILISAFIAQNWINSCNSTGLNGLNKIIASFITIKLGNNWLASLCVDLLLMYSILTYIVTL